METRKSCLRCLTKTELTLDKAVTRLPLAVHALCLLMPGILRRETDKNSPLVL